MFSDFEEPLDTLRAHTLVNVGLTFLRLLFQQSVGRVRRNHKVNELE